MEIRKINYFGVNIIEKRIIIAKSKSERMKIFERDHEIFAD